MKHEAKNLCLGFIFIASIASSVGCDVRLPTKPASAARPTSGATVDRVCQIAAELMKVERSKVVAETSLGELGADDLDFVELVMELEEQFEVSIPDEAAESILGRDDWQQGMKNVTMAKLAAVVDGLKPVPRAGSR